MDFVPERTTIIIVTYIIAVFSIVIQGATLVKLVDFIYPDTQRESQGGGS